MEEPHALESWVAVNLDLAFCDYIERHPCLIQTFVVVVVELTGLVEAGTGQPLQSGIRED